jgi:uncharacterized protein YjbJ (UPF0337 family)
MERAMNKIKLTGIGLIGLGTVERTAGRMLASRKMQARGFAHQVAGQSKVAIGTAMSRVGGRLQAVRRPEVAVTSNDT